MTDAPYKFPKNFLWGGSISSHQAEGGTYNQWTVWELENASELAKTAEHRLGHLKNWEEIKHQAQEPANYVSGEGVAHYDKFRDDFRLAKQLNLNTLRFSLEWSRIEPEEGVWDEEAIRHYKDYIDQLKEFGLEPFLNIWHWTNPVWFEEKGGFAKRTNHHHFYRYVDRLAQEFAQDVKYVVTLNEVTTYLTNGYITGQWPPEHKNILTGLKLYWYFVQIHKKSYEILKSYNAALQIGVANTMTAQLPARPDNPIDKFSARLAGYWDRWFLNHIRQTQDFVGFNFYFTNYLRAWRLANPAEPVNDLGWYMEPGRLYDVIMELNKRYKKPIFVTESGLADADDNQRKWWLEESMKAMERAIQDDADLRGYFHWSLLDNFEWSQGWWPKFGLLAVDRENMERTIRPSARWWSKQLKGITEK